MSSALRRILCILPALVLAACGGGAGLDAVPTDLGTSPVGKATLTGEIVTLDGQAVALSGVRLHLRETGQTVTSGADGWFTFGEVPAGTLTIDLAGVPATVLQKGDGSMGMDDDSGMGMDDGDHGMGGDDDHGTGGDDDHGTGMDDDDDHGPGMDDDDHRGEDCDDPDHFHHGGECYDWDEVDDGERAGDDHVLLHRTQDRERVHVRLRIRDGVIQELVCIRDSFDEREIERWMDRHADLDDPDMRCRVELEEREDRERLRCDLEEATEGRNLELVAISPDGDEEVLGVRTVDADGECHWTFDTSEGARLPFRVGSLDDLDGYRLEIRDADTGEVLFEMDLYGMPPTMGHWADCDEDHEYGHGMHGDDDDLDDDDDHGHMGMGDDCDDDGDADQDRDRDGSGDDTP